MEEAGGVQRGAGSLHLPRHEAGRGGLPLQPGLHLRQSLQQHYRYHTSCSMILKIMLPYINAEGAAENKLMSAPQALTVNKHTVFASYVQGVWQAGGLRLVIMHSCLRLDIEDVGWPHEEHGAAWAH